MLTRIVKYFIPNNESNDPTQLRLARVRILIFLFTALFYLMFIPVALDIGFKYQEWVDLIAATGCLIAAFMYRAGVNRDVCAHTYSLFAGGAIFAGTYMGGGLYAPAATGILLMPATSMLVGGKRTATIWLFICIAFIGYLYMLSKTGQEPTIYFTQEHRLYLMFSGLVAMLIILFISLLVFENEKNIAFHKMNERNVELSWEKERSDNLLLNILPAEVANELKTTGKATSRLFEHVTVLFTDFVNFTIISENLTPEQLVNEIDYCFSAFDDIITKYNLEKIKTIGDAYLAACGLPDELEDHATRTVNAALEIRQFMWQHKKECIVKGKPFLEIRIGIHSGHVVAGIVGKRKFAYDIWGDTVNTAARMEQCGEPGRINISESTFNSLNDQFEFTPRGKIEAKNKGHIEMYFVEKRSMEDDK